MKIILFLFPIFCFSMTFEENFSLMTDYYKNSFSNDNEIKILFPNDYKKKLNEPFNKGDKILFLFFPQNCGLNLLVKDENKFENVQAVRNYIVSKGFKVTYFQFISDIANFKNIQEMNNFYLKYFGLEVDLELVESSFSNHCENYFFPIKFCLLKLQKI